MAAQNSKATARKRAPGRPFQKGVSGNPGGRPKKNRPLIIALEQHIKSEDLADKLWELAIGGDLQAIKYIYDRIEGTPTQRHEFDLPAEAERLLRDLGMDATPEAVGQVIDLARERERRAG